MLLNWREILLLRGHLARSRDILLSQLYKGCYWHLMSRVRDLPPHRENDRSSKCWHTLLHNILKITFINIIPSIHQKILIIIGKILSSWRQIQFANCKMLIFTESLYFITSSKYCQLFPLSDRLTLFICKKISAKDHNLSIGYSFK